MSLVVFGSVGIAQVQVDALQAELFLQVEVSVYHDALMSLNNRICAELGLFYDADYNLVRKG